MPRSNTVPKPIPFANAILCEHIVHGVAGKPTLIGVFSGDIMTAEFPAQIWAAIFAEVSTEAAGGGGTINLYICIDGKDAGTVGMTFPDDANTDFAVALIPSGLLTIEKECVLKVDIWAEGYDRTTIIEKRIFLAPPGLL